MTGSAAVPLAKLFDLIERDIVTGEVQHAVKQHRSMPGRQHEAIAIRPLGIPWTVLEEASPQNICRWRKSHRRAGMPRIRLLDCVDRQRADRIDAQLIKRLTHRFCLS